MRVVNTSVRKKDAMQLVTGQPVYVDDLAPQDCLIVKLLRSPYANAMVKTINTAIAMKVRASRQFIPGRMCRRMQSATHRRGRHTRRRVRMTVS